MAGITFHDCLMYAVAQQEFVKEFDRLMGCNLSKAAYRAPIEQMVDDATGYLDQQLALFVAFVYEIVWTRLPVELRNMETDPLPEIALPLREYEEAHP